MGTGEIEARATYVLHLERGDWKVVHVHRSFPQANLAVLGRSLTVTLEELEKTVQREQPDLSTTLAADGTVTIVFTDIVDSTLMVGSLGDQALPRFACGSGVHTGDALQEADHFFGTTVHYAARVASQASGGEVLVSSLVHELLSGADVGFLESREVELKGLPGSHRLFPVDLT